MSAIRAAATAAARATGRGPGLASLLPASPSALSSTHLAFAAARLVSGDLVAPTCARGVCGTAAAGTKSSEGSGAAEEAGFAAGAAASFGAPSEPSVSAPALSAGDASAAASALASPGSVDFAGRDKNLVMLFTCVKCDTRSAKAFSRRSYEQGVVIVTCPGCGSRHLVADHLGWFGQKGNLAQFADEHGFAFKEGLADGTMEISPEDVIGTKGGAQA